MSMQAVRLTRENFPIILGATPTISELALEEVWTLAEQYREETYIIPNYYSPVANAHRWMCVRKDYLDSAFSYDADKIQTQLVEITRK